jgi:16S rRNA pseudouridine516 synthase
MAERLDAYLSHRGFGSRSETRDLIRGGGVTIAGAPCRDPARHVAGEVIAVRGQDVVDGPDAATLIMHKPLGYACSRDEREAPLLDELVPPALRHLGLEPAGRLDRDTSGMIIVTSDGQLIHSLTNPRKKLMKRYRVGYSGRLSAHAEERCAKGIMLDGDPRPTLPAKLVLLDSGRDGVSDAILYLCEGRFHQVRRMIAALGGEVVRLHRDRIGRLDLPGDLTPGASREITAYELGKLMDPAE